MNKLTGWKISLGLESCIIGSIYSFLPFLTFTKFGLNNIWVFLLVPLTMLFFTPLWIRIKKKHSNHVVLKINSTFLMIFLTTIMIFNFFDNNYLIYGYAINLWLIGMFLAGMVPFTMEIIRSYGISNKIKVNPTLLFSLVGIFPIIIPFLCFYFLEQNILNIVLICYFGGWGIGLWITIHRNQNIMTNEITFATNNGNFKMIWKNKPFLAYLFPSSFTYGFNEFIGYLLPVLVFNQTIYWIIWIGVFYFLRKLSYLGGSLFSINKQKVYYINIINSILVIISIGLFLGMLIINYYRNNLLTTSLYLIIGIGVSQILIGISLALITKTQKTNVTSLVGRDNMSLAMIIDHVFGRGILSLLFSIILIPIIIVNDAKPIIFIILLSCFTIISIINLMLVTNNKIIINS
ncbi:hypothetical protein [Spiroplasma eriocheiris]|uniref:Uncharacterized protein n=1 Tax=Spiroplasma eriocheiris TaxID=315358 RepID=A0A0H3XHJ3_9MOLU|nr:hypothetical protein [Spiroplasma eriocheiris]AHF57732.1 putative transmembrane protein [Spiroplasma eriocheiris CCTCC M 207170]AKM54183.1 hypothetical protein SERIO_v1c06120 [Spiroplasma eriocheiris]